LKIYDRSTPVDGSCPTPYNASKWSRVWGPIELKHDYSFLQKYKTNQKKERKNPEGRERRKKRRLVIEIEKTKPNQKYKSGERETTKKQKKHKEYDSAAPTMLSYFKSLFFNNYARNGNTQSPS
jgi:hypothetical protein